MTLETLFQIILTLFTVIFIFGLLLVSYLIGRVSVVDNPYNAFVYIKTGSHISKPKKASAIETTSKGITYKCGKRLISVPSKYQEVFFRGRRVVYINFQGQLIASPFNGDSEITPSEKEDLIYDFIEANVGRNAIAAIQSKTKKTNIIIIAVVAFFVGALIVYGFLQFQTNQQNRTSINQIETPNPIIEVIP